MLALGGMGRSGFGRMGLVGSTSYNPLAALGSDLLAWWDADSSYWGANGSITIATGVSSWKDNVAGYNATQATGSAQPAFSATGFNGAPGVTFDGVDDFLNSTDAALLAALPAGANGSELWVLVDDGGSGTRVFTCYGNGSTTIRAIGASGSAPRRPFVAIGDGAAQQNLTSTTNVALGRHIQRLEVGATSSNMYMDNVLDPISPLAVVPASTSSKFRIGANANGTVGNFAQGTYAAVFATKPLGSKASSFGNWLMSRRG